MLLIEKIAWIWKQFDWLQWMILKINNLLSLLHFNHHQKRFNPILTMEDKISGNRQSENIQFKIKVELWINYLVHYALWYVVLFESVVTVVKLRKAQQSLFKQLPRESEWNICNVEHKNLYLKIVMKCYTRELTYLLKILRCL